MIIRKQYKKVIKLLYHGPHERAIMKIQLSDLTTERKWRAATGFDKQRFEKLSELFKKAYIKIYGKSVKERQVQTEINYCLNSEEDLLFFTLFSLKSSLTYDLLGLVCGMEASNAKRNQKTGLGGRPMPNAIKRRD